MLLGEGVVIFVFLGYLNHRELHVLTHPFPPRRASDLSAALGVARHVTQPSPATRPARRPGTRPSPGQRCGRRRSRRCVARRSEEHTSELQSLMRISYAVFCLKKKTIHTTQLQ